LQNKYIGIELSGLQWLNEQSITAPPIRVSVAAKLRVVGTRNSLRNYRCRMQIVQFELTKYMANSVGFSCSWVYLNYWCLSSRFNARCDDTKMW